MSFKQETLLNGDLRFTLTDRDLEDFREERADTSMRRFYGLSDFLESMGLIGDGWGEVLPEDIGALTSAPILTDDLCVRDDGTSVAEGNVWWFPNYCVEDPMQTLADTGSVTFTAAPKD